MQSQKRASFFEFATLLRVVCLSLTAVSALTAYFWIYQQDTINSIDKKVSSAHLGQYRPKLYAMKNIYNQKKYEKAADQIEDILGSMSYIRTRDKSYNLKRKLTLILIQSKIQLGMPHAAEALPYAKFWAESDERDITALRAYIQLLSAIPGKEEDLKKATTLFHDRFPGESASFPVK
ncbi:MAG: hypothetical protein ACI9JM_000420 [Halioglobus sp.]|jgi:hypothetical protein